jgi:hypothetical protein
VHKYAAKSFYADAREGSYVSVALGGFRKRAVDIVVTTVAAIRADANPARHSRTGPLADWQIFL